MALRVIFIQAPYIDDYGPMRKAAGTYFPLGLGYISSYIKQFDYSVRLLDPNVQLLPTPALVDIVSDERPVLVGISFMTPQFFRAKEIADAIKSALPDVPIVLGGAHPSALPTRTLEEIQSADFSIYGEGEETTLELLDFLTRQKGSLHEIKGLAWRNGSEAVLNPPRAPIGDLDRLPYPDREQIDQHLYRQQSFLAYSTKYMPIYTSRGCPGRCVFCLSGHGLKSRVRERSIENVMEEIDYIVERYKIDYLLIKDDMFTLRRSRVRDFCNALKERHPGLKWHCMGRVSSVDRELLSDMKAAGLNDIFFGIESGNDEILKRSGKAITTAQARKAVEDCAALGIRTYGTFILGLPGDTRETIGQTLDFACSLPLTMAGFSILIPYPGTKAFEDYYVESTSASIDYQNFISTSGLHVARGYTGLVDMELDELPALISRAQRRFYLRPRRIARMIWQSPPAMILRYARAAFALASKEFWRLFRQKDMK